MPVSTIQQIAISKVTKFVSGPIFDPTVNLLPAVIEPLFNQLITIPDQPGSRPIIAGLEMNITGNGNQEAGTTFFGEFIIDNSNISILDLNNSDENMTQVNKDLFKPLVLDNISITNGRHLGDTEFDLGVLTLARKGIKTIKINVPLIDSHIESALVNVTKDFFSIDASGTTLSQFTVEITPAKTIILDGGSVNVTEPALKISKSITVPNNLTKLTAEIQTGTPNSLVLSYSKTIATGTTVFRIVNKQLFHRRDGNFILTTITFIKNDFANNKIILQTGIGLRTNSNFSFVNVAEMSIVSDRLGAIHANDINTIDITSISPSFSNGRKSDVNVNISFISNIGKDKNGIFNSDAFSRPIFSGVYTINNNNVNVNNFINIQIDPTFIQFDSTNFSTQIRVTQTNNTQIYKLDSTSTIRSVFDLIEIDFPDIKFSFITYGELNYPDTLGNTEVESYKNWPSSHIRPTSSNINIPGQSSLNMDVLGIQSGRKSNIGFRLTGNNVFISDIVKEFRKRVSGIPLEINVDGFSGWEDMPLFFVADVSSTIAINSINALSTLTTNIGPVPVTFSGITSHLMRVDLVGVIENLFDETFLAGNSGNAISLVSNMLLDININTDIKSVVNFINNSLVSFPYANSFSIAEIVPGFENVTSSSILIDSPTVFFSLFSNFDFNTQSNVGETNIISSFPLLNTKTINDLATDITTSPDGWSNFITVDTFLSNDIKLQNTLNITALVDLLSQDVNGNNNQFIANATFLDPLNKTFDLALFTQDPAGIQQLVTDMSNAFLNDNITFTYTLDSNQFPEATPLSLNTFAHNDLKLLSIPQIFTGSFDTLNPISSPSYNFEINYDIQFAGVKDVTEGGPAGVQVAFGGIEKDGVFSPSKAPNSWLEPGFNTQLSVSFDVSNTDIIYILIRTRTDVQGNAFNFDPSDYFIQVNYSNGDPDPNAIPFIPIDAQFANIWNDDFGNGLKNPVVIAIPITSAFLDITINDIKMSESIIIRVNENPGKIDEFGFLAINRSNINSTKSQRISKSGRTFGLVLDSQGIWDIIIAPEAIIKRSSSDISFNHLGLGFSRTFIDADDEYVMSINNGSSLPTQVLASLKLVPIIGQKQVWALEIDFRLKQYLKKIRENSTGSLDGCSVDIDILVQAKHFPNVQGLCRISIFTDYTCVFNLNLCDFFWNLTEPPNPNQQELIENNISAIYSNLIDCDVISNAKNLDKTNIEIEMPVLVDMKNIPTFANGNALLLIKSQYSEIIQAFRNPTIFNQIQFNNCEFLNTNIPLITKLNREIVVDHNGQEITDPVQIQIAIASLSSFIWIRPRFQFPPVDIVNELSSGEIVIFGVGYTFKNWFNGVREDQFLINVGMKLSAGLFTKPELFFSHKYYYNQDKT